MHAGVCYAEFMKLSPREARELALSEILLIILAAIGLAVVVWLAWIRPAQQIKDTRVTSYASCVAAGNPVQASYPSVCVGKDGQRFVNPNEKVAQPKQQYLALKEWSMRVPVTNATFDLVYHYDKNDTYEGMFFTFKRLADAGICKSDAGVALTRTTVENQPPYAEDNLKVFKHIGDYYYYVAYGNAPCYDSDNPAQVRAVQAINGGNLKDAITGNLQNLQTAPTE